MSRLKLLTVEDAFQISGRGCLLTPGLPASTKLRLGPRMTVRLVRPDGEVFDSVIKGLDALHNRRTDEPEVRFFITLPESVSPTEVPPGTTIFWPGG
jgi:hypothetical protein